MLWNEKPYYSLDAYCKNTFGKKLYKIAINGGMTCPNRDGKIDTRGCIFCSAGGSGEFAAPPFQNCKEQIAYGLSLMQGKKTGSGYIAYFQSYTNTYAPVSKLRSLYQEALEDELIAGISIATRPDCLPDEVLSLLAELKSSYPDKFIWIELGLQTIHEETALYIRRGYPLSVFEDAFSNLQKIGIPVIVHIILGLPFETEEMMLETISYINSCNPFGIKLQLLHVLKGTDLLVDYENKLFDVLTMEQYLSILERCITHLSPEIVIHRVTGDGPKSLLVAPTWSLNKRLVLNTLHKEMKEKQLWQGKDFVS